MFPLNKSTRDITSTPKRHRLGLSRISRPSPKNTNKSSRSIISNCTPINLKLIKESSQRCDSPPLPCNQIEYLCDSGNNSSACSDIPHSSGILNSSVIRDIENWESVLENKNNGDSTTNDLAEIEDISDDMFYSRLEQSVGDEKDIKSNCKENFKSSAERDLSGVNSIPEQSAEDDIVMSHCEKNFRNTIEQSFAVVDKSNRGLIPSQSLLFEMKEDLFETKDSFLLDIKESCVVKEDAKTKGRLMTDNVDNFYGLPIKTKSFFKTYRNIEKFYGMCVKFYC